MTLIMKTNLFYGLLFLTLIYSCTNDDVWDGIESTNIHPQSGSVLSDFDTFSKILSKAVSNNSDLRAFIKEEALKMTDNDYDVFYPLVKNKKVTADKTFKEILNENKPIIGYYGAFASWFDYDMVSNLAKQRPEYNIVLIGSKYDDSLEKSNIEKLDNVFYLGTKDYKILKNYANRFNVCIVPFVINDITKATSPLKIFEYMALEKPIVTTAMDECKKYKSIFIANDQEEFVNLIDKTLKLNKEKNTEYYETLKQEALENTWESKAKVIVKLLETEEM